MDDDENPSTPPLLASTPKPSAAAAAADELLLLRFRSSLKWCALDLSSSVRRTASYLTFLIFTILIPITISHLLLPRLTAAAAAVTNHSFNQLVQLPESSLAAIAFFTLSGDTSGIPQLLLLDGLLHDSAAVRHGYARRVDRAFRYLAAVLLPSFSVELAHKAVIFNAPSAAPLWRSAALAAAVASWVYRTGVFLLVCVLFRLTCELQILRFEELYQMFAFGGWASSEKVEAVMFREHARIRMQLTETSHRYRIFILGSLVTITVSQLGALMMVLCTKTEKNFSNSGDLVVCSVVQLSGFLMCLLGAARITHKAQRVVSIASRWHVIMSSSKTKHESIADPHESDGQDYEPIGSLEPPVSQMHSSYESRQALGIFILPPLKMRTPENTVTYLQHNGGGITIFGFALDRSLLHTLFAFEMTLVLWILSKVVVLS